MIEQQAHYISYFAACSWRPVQRFQPCFDFHCPNFKQPILTPPRLDPFPEITFVSFLCRIGDAGIASHQLSLLKMPRQIGKCHRFLSNPNIIQIDFSSETKNRLPGGGDAFQVISRSKNDAAVYSSAVWPALAPPEAPNIRPSLAPLNCHTSVLHIASPFLHE
ncbi:MAG: hypothetical protein WA621_00285 [Candidatus Acidiferrum sp.]